ncbi:MAG: ATP-binding protein [Candidatus Anammoxibacter sp.]
MKEELKIRPYARLLTMLGEQLIKNERIALVELIKNAYDADADWVKISFEDFGENFEIDSKSKIIIEDNGEGMTEDVIKKAWMNPATPNKYIKDGVRLTATKKRIIQGEKGIGRFSILKLGRSIKVYTKPLNSKEEYVIDYDLSRFDDDYLTEDGINKEIFIDDILIPVYTQKAKHFLERDVRINNKIFQKNLKGTRIEISDLKGTWSFTKLNDAYRDVLKLESIFTKLFGKKEQKKNQFQIGFEFNKEKYSIGDEFIEKLKNLLENNSVFQITNGVFDNKKNEYRFKLNGKNMVVNFDDPNIRGKKVCREHFEDIKTKEKRYPSCGSFKYNFFIFDFAPNAPAKYQLDRNDKDLLKKHRIYLYRDGIRVYPYGEPNDDWLQIDTLRGVYGAGQFFSNDQIVGWVEITKEGNKKLKDKTNREGLISFDEGEDDFIGAIQTILSYIRKHPYDIYRNNLQSKKSQEIFKTEQVQKDFDSLKKHFDKIQDKKSLSLISKTEKQYLAERRFLVQRAETTEELAGVGLSVETASHDIMSFMGKALNTLDELIRDSLNDDIDNNILQEELHKLKGMLSFIEAQLKDIQLLFRSSKQRRKQIRVNDMLDKVIRIYRKQLRKDKINIEIIKAGSPLVAKSTEAVLLQLFLNLLDNSIFWLGQISISNKKILVTLDGKNGKLIFSDNGPGVNPDDKPYIFEPFFSGKGEEGRGLGLYIAKQLLERIDYSINLADLKKDKILSGANFVVDFVLGDD